MRAPRESKGAPRESEWRAKLTTKLSEAWKGVIKPLSGFKAHKGLTRPLVRASQST